MFDFIVCYEGCQNFEARHIVFFLMQPTNICLNVYSNLFEKRQYLNYFCERQT